MGISASAPPIAVDGRPWLALLIVEASMRQQLAQNRPIVASRGDVDSPRCSSLVQDAKLKVRSYVPRASSLDPGRMRCAYLLGA